MAQLNSQSSGSRGSIKPAGRSLQAASESLSPQARYRLVRSSPTVARMIFEPPEVGFVRYIESITWQDGMAADTFAFMYLLLTQTTGSTATPVGQPSNIVWIEHVPTVVGENIGYSVNFATPLLWEPSFSLIFGNFNSPAAGPKTASVQITESSTS